MTLAYYFDEHVPWPVTHGLRSREIDVLIVQDDEARGEDDEPLLARATELGRVLFTHDDDFLMIGAEWLRAGREFAGLVYVHQNRLSYRARIDDLIRLSHTYTPVEMRNRIIYLPLRAQESRSK